MKKNNGCIYVIKNTVNDKVYVGQTVNINERWRQHKTAANREYNHNNRHSILYPAMRKHGIENFYIEILEDNIESSLLNAREKYWIEKYNSVRPNGYNILPGTTIGEQAKRSIYQLDKDTCQIINEFDSITEASKVTGTYISGIHKVLSNHLLTAKNFRWCYKDNYEEYIKNPPQKCSDYYKTKSQKNNKELRKTKKVLQIDKDTKQIIQEWNSVKEACIAINCSTKTMYNAINGHKETCKGFIWRYNN